MHRLKNAKLFLLIFAQSVIANEYYFQFQSGYCIKIKTPEQVTLEQAIDSSISIEVTIISNNLQQQPLDQSSGLELINNIVPEILEQYNQPATLVFSHTIQVAQVSQVLQNQLGLVTSTSHLPQLSTHRKESEKQNAGRRKFKDENGIIKYPCSYPGCTELLTNRDKRAKHHKTHFSQEFMDSLEANSFVACPVCGRALYASLAVILSHMGRGRCKQE